MTDESDIGVPQRLRDMKDTELMAFFRGWWEGMALWQEDPRLAMKLLGSQHRRVQGSMSESMRKEMRSIAMMLMVEEDLESLGVE